MKKTKKPFPTLKGAFKNQHGISIVQVIVAAGLLGVVALGTMSLVGTLQKGQKTSQIQMDVLEFRRQAVTALADKFNCEKTLVGKNIGDEIDEIFINDKAFLVKDQEYSEGRLKVIRMITAPVEPPADHVLGGNMYKIEFQVDFDVKKKHLSYGTRKSFKTLLTVQASGPDTGQIQVCFDDRENTIKTARALVCEDLGGTWDNTNQQCTGFECPDKHLVGGFNKDGLICDQFKAEADTYLTENFVNRNFDETLNLKKEVDKYLTENFVDKRTFGKTLNLKQEVDKYLTENFVNRTFDETLNMNPEITDFFENQLRVTSYNYSCCGTYMNLGKAFFCTVRATESFSCSLSKDKSGNWIYKSCLLYTSPSPRDVEESRMPSSA